MDAKPILMSEADAGLSIADDPTSLLVVLADAVQAIVAYFDDQLIYRFANKTYQHWFMKSHSEIVGHSAKEVLGPSFSKVEKYLNAARAGKPQAFEIAFDFPDGQFRTLQVEYIPHRSTSGKVIGLFVIGFDISELREAKDASERDAKRFLEAGDLYKALFLAAPDPTISIDLDGTILEMNDQVQRVFGYKPNKLLGQCVDILVPDALRKNHVRHRRKYSKNPQTRPMGQQSNLLARAKDGREFPVEINLSPIQHTDRQIVIASIRDISVRKAAESAKLAQERNYRMLLESSNAIPWEADATTWLFTYVGPQAVELLGYPQKLWLGKNFWVDHIHPDDRAWTIEFCQKSTKNRDNYEFEYRMVAKDGAIVWFQDIVNVIRENGRATGLRGFMIDVTERKEAEKALHESEERFAFAVAGSQDGLWDWDLQTGEAYFSPRWKEILGYEDHELDNDPEVFWDLVHADDLARLKLAIEAHLKDHEPYCVQFRLRHKDGSYVWVQAKGQAIWDEDGNPLRMAGSNADITERKLHEELLRDLGARFISAQEEERKKIARELHDDLSQELALIAVELDLICNELPKRRRNSRLSIRQHLAQIRAMARDAASAVHRMSHQLHPAMLDQLGMASAIAAYCSEVSSRQETKVEFTDKGVPRNIPPDVSLNFYRILQESIQNALKHGGADRIEVKLYPDGKNICLSVSDEGIGFDPNSEPGLGLGLTSIKERARLIGADCEISSEPGKGTKVSVCKMLNKET